MIGRHPHPEARARAAMSLRGCPGSSSTACPSDAGGQHRQQPQEVLAAAKGHLDLCSTGTGGWTKGSGIPRVTTAMQEPNDHRTPPATTSSNAPQPIHFHRDPGGHHLEGRVSPSVLVRDLGTGLWRKRVPGPGKRAPPPPRGWTPAPFLDFRRVHRRHWTGTGGSQASWRPAARRADWERPRASLERRSTRPDQARNARGPLLQRRRRC
jgi:hypothetical protein